MNGEWPWGSNFRSRLNKMAFRLNITDILGNLDGHGAAGRVWARRACLRGALTAGLRAGCWGWVHARRRGAGAGA